MIPLLYGLFFAFMGVGSYFYFVKRKAKKQARIEVEIKALAKALRKVQDAYHREDLSAAQRAKLSTLYKRLQAKLEALSLELAN